MTDIKITRTLKVEGEDNIAIKTSEYKNGTGHSMVQTLEEHNISVEEIDNVITKLQPEELTKVNKEIVELEQEIKEIKDEIDPLVASDEYKKFLEYLKSDEYKRLGSILSKSKALNVGVSKLKNLQDDKADVENWGVQFTGLKSEISRVNPEPEKVDEELVDTTSTE